MTTTPKRKGKSKNTKKPASGKKGAAKAEAVVIIKRGENAKHKKPGKGKPKKGQTPPTKNAKKKTPKPKIVKEKTKTAEELDREMEAYFMKDEKVASKKLDEDLDTYWEQKKAKEGEEAKAEE